MASFQICAVIPGARETGDLLDCLCARCKVAIHEHHRGVFGPALAGRDASIVAPKGRAPSPAVCALPGGPQVPLDRRPVYSIAFASLSR